MLKLLTIAAAILLSGQALALDPGEMFDDPEKEDRARTIGRELRCLVCQNQSIFDSNAGLAKDLRVVVRERIEAGDSNEEAIAYIAARYGDYVLLEPPVDIHTYALWTAPVAFLLIGLAMVRVVHRKNGKTAPAPLDETDRLEAQRLLEGDKG